MHDLTLVLTLTGGLAFALVLGYLTHRLGLSSIVGYLLAGVAVGPFTPGFVADRVLAEQLAEVGVILLMFGVGLHFDFRELVAVRRVALPGAIAQSLVATALGLVVARLLGWGWAAGIVYGLALSVASTVVLMRVLAESGDLHTRAGHVAVGWLVVEDVFTVLVLVLLPPLLGEGGSTSEVAWALVRTLIGISVLVSAILLVGGRVIPWLLGRAAATRSRELFTLTVLVVALALAVGSAKGFGVSMALGAFLAGMVVGRSEFSSRAASEALPMRDAFAVLFFVSVGMLFEPRRALESPGLLAATLGIVLLAKPATALAIVLLLGHPLRAGLSVAVALAQIGEFSFMLAALGRSLGVLGTDAMNAVVGAAVLSIALNPLLYRLVVPAEALAMRSSHVRAWVHARLRRAEAAPPERAGPPDPRHHAVVVGYGPVGQTVTRLLRENGVTPTIIELNLETVHAIKESGIAAVYGDASHAQTLEAARVPCASTIVLSASAMQGADAVVRTARELNPNVRVLARADYVSEVPGLRAAGADHVFSGESEVALAMTVAILRELGATPEQVDLERDRVRRELGR